MKTIKKLDSNVAEASKACKKFKAFVETGEFSSAAMQAPIEVAKKQCQDFQTQLAVAKAELQAL